MADLKTGFLGPTRAAAVSNYYDSASVCGHFKIRKHCVYWWSPFLRGDPRCRERYEVVE